MSLNLRRVSAAVLATAMMVSFAAEPVLAQATTGPASGVGSTTAPSNSEGTPAGGTGTLGTTRVGPSTTARSTHRARHRTHRARRPVATPATTGTQSESGLNGSATPTR